MLEITVKNLKLIRGCPVNDFAYKVFPKEA
jgi:hypothetical protein